MLHQHHIVQLAMASPSLSFTVRRQAPELVTPDKPTPIESKSLSDIDSQESLYFHTSIIQFYRGKHPTMEGIDPVTVIREAVARTLVYYYPLAGRLRKGPNGRLVVECTGEGVLFIEADAEVRLEELGDELCPPFPFLEDFLFDVPGSRGILNCPLLLIQVTRLKGGGFVFALRLNHTMSDGVGMIQFMAALAEITRGALSPSVQPVWQRELLNARDSPRVTCTHELFQTSDNKNIIAPPTNMVHQSFFFGPTQVFALRRLIPQRRQSCSTFEVLTASLWRSRTIALQLDPNKQVRVILSVNARAIFRPPLPIGYYGNAFGFTSASSTARELCENPLGYAVNLVTNAKANVTDEYMRSLADLQVVRGRAMMVVDGTYAVSDVTRAGFRDIDFGWGKAVYGGPTEGGTGPIPGLVNFLIPFKNKRGENRIMVRICLPDPAMDRFVMELESLLREDQQVASNGSSYIQSSL